MHWGGVEAQPAYELPHDGEAELAVSTRLPSPGCHSQRRLRQSQSKKCAQSALPGSRHARLHHQPSRSQCRNSNRAFYTMTDICCHRWGMARDLSSADIRSPIALGQGAHSRAGAAAQVDRSGWAQGKTRALCVSSYTLPIFALGCDAMSVLVECG